MEGIDFSSVFIFVNPRLLLVEIQTIFLFIYVCVLGQCTRHFKQVLHPCMLTISSLETDLLQILPLRTFLSQILTQVMQFPHFGDRGSCNTVSSGASVKTVPRHCAAPYSGVISRLFFQSTLIHQVVQRFYGAILILLFHNRIRRRLIIPYRIAKWLYSPFR